MTDHELNLAIARMMPGWTETKENKPPCWFEYGDKIIMFRSERDQTVWSPSTDLNNASEAVRAILDTPAKVVAWSMEDTLGGASFSAIAGPRAWCEALVAVGGAK